MTRATLILSHKSEREKAKRWMQCSVDGCDRNAHWTAKGIGGMCSAHAYRSKRHGDPLGGRTAPGDAAKYLSDVVIPCRDDACLIWPFARNSAGYGHIWQDGRNVLVHRIACESRHGSPPGQSYVAAHDCGNGHLGCCNPRHLRWATLSENHADMNGHGTIVRGERQHMAKLTAVDVIEIRSTPESAERSAQRFGVSAACIRAVRSRKSWKHVS